MAIQGPVLESKDMYSYGFSGNGEKMSEKAKIFKNLCKNIQSLKIR